MRYIEKVDVVIADSESKMPNTVVDCVAYGTDDDMRSPDINKGHGGKFVWLVPVYTEDRERAAEGFRVLNTVEEHETALQNLFAGCEGSDRRYIRRTLVDPDFPKKKVTQVALIRTASMLHSPESIMNWWGVPGLSEDINRGRGGSYLYLSWEYESSIG